jgi:hypothetical protein
MASASGAALAAIMAAYGDVSERSAATISTIASLKS